MAQKRMFSLSVTETDEFLDLPTSSQALYFHLGMHGDDDGFVSSPKKIMRTCGANLDDIRILSTKGFVIPFDSGVLVLRDWRLNNTLKNDRYRPTIYQAEMEQLNLDSSGRYTLEAILEPKRLQEGSNSEPQQSLTEHSLTEHNATDENTKATGKGFGGRDIFQSLPSDSNPEDFEQMRHAQMHALAEHIQQPVKGE